MRLKKTQPKKRNLKKRTSKKVLIAQISEATGKTHKELESLARANIQTIEWVKSLIG